MSHTWAAAALLAPAAAAVAAVLLALSKAAAARRSSFWRCFSASSALQQAVQWCHTDDIFQVLTRLVTVDSTLHGCGRMVLAACFAGDLVPTASHTSSRSNGRRLPLTSPTGQRSAVQAGEVTQHSCCAPAPRLLILPLLLCALHAVLLLRLVHGPAGTAPAQHQHQHSTTPAQRSRGMGVMTSKTRPVLLADGAISPSTDYHSTHSSPQLCSVC